MFFVVLMWHSLSCSWYIYLFQFSFINFSQKNVKKKMQQTNKTSVDLLVKCIIMYYLLPE